tara:strand:- start:814 stop:1626 length:813 start_codon:yes stop_codon:yes gene_type:complete
MKIDRQQFLQELKLREYIQKAIRVIRERKEKEQESIVKEEQRLRNIIRSLLKEEGEGDESTGIAFLRRDLNKILGVLEDGYISLRTSFDQRKSYRAHILNAIQNLITVSDTNFNATPDKDPGEEAVGIEEAIDVSIGDEAPDPKKKIDIGRKKPEDEEEEKDTEQAKEEAELEDFAIAGEDRTGAVEALRSMKQIENVIKKTYNGLFDPNDRDLYADYLITNLQLYFDEFEEELQAMIPEPENPDYEQRKAVDTAPEPDTGLALEEEDPL